MVLRMGCERWLGPTDLDRKLAPRAPSHFAQGQATSALRAPLCVMETWDFSALDSLGGLSPPPPSSPPSPSSAARAAVPLVAARRLGR